VQPFESEITHAISSEPPTHCATVVPVPIQGVKMSSKPFSWLFDVIVGQHERNWREFSVAGFIFTYARKYFSVFLTGGGGDRPRRPPPLWIRHWFDGAQGATERHAVGSMADTDYYRSPLES